MQRLAGTLMIAAFVAALSAGTPAPAKDDPLPIDPARTEAPLVPVPALDEPGGAAGGGGATPADPVPVRPASKGEICAALASAAAEHELPVPFFVRLIWQESRLDPFARSRAGALGIAQFMPRTADWRGLADPYDPITALWKSAHYLNELRSEFGNLGLAAAAYNGGSGRVQAWLAGRRPNLPRETRAYVRIVTGFAVEQWRGTEIPAIDGASLPEEFPCPLIVASAPAVRTVALGGRSPLPRARPAPPEHAWTVQLAGNWSEDKARAHYDALKRKFEPLLGGREALIVTKRVAGRGPAAISQVRVAEASRAGAEKLCSQLRAAGAGCIVLRNF
jgi:hypothetical protein